MQRGRRIIVCGHHGFGPNHLHRSRALAAVLTADDPAASVLILTGSRLAGDFIWPERVDHVRLPGIIQRADGSCVAEALGLDIDEITAFRASLIKSVVAAFDPDLLIVAGEPSGFRGELLPTLEALTGKRRSRIVLCLVDVLGEGHRPGIGAPVRSNACAWMTPNGAWCVPASWSRNSAQESSTSSRPASESSLGGGMDPDARAYLLPPAPPKWQKDAARCAFMVWPTLKELI